MIKYTFKQGLNGKWYAVFRDCVDAEDASFAFEGCLIVCFDGYENAYQVSPWTGNDGGISGITIPNLRT